MASLRAVFRSFFLDKLHPIQPYRYEDWAEELTWVALIVFAGQYRSLLKHGSDWLTRKGF